MEKMKMESIDGVQSNIEKIAELFPNCITEALDTEKSTPDHPVYKKAINFKNLQQMLSGDIADENEAYEMTWVGKKAAIVEANKPIRKTLRPCPEESVNWDTTENLYIEGDNLEVLKLLQESYLGKIRFIYIDPPYNTGSDFIYKDDFSTSREEYSQEIEEFDENGIRLFKNTEANGRIHSDWCSMMYSRLLLSRNLLTDDGAIFVSIDEHEYLSLLAMMNEIFGEANYIDTIIWDKKASAKGVPPKTMMVNVHEYIVAFSKNDNFKFIGEKRTAESGGFKNPDNDPRGPWRMSNIKSTTKPIEDSFTITDPNTGRQYTNTWAFSKESLEQMIKEDRILWKETLPKQKEFLYEMTNENMAIKSNWGVFDAQSTTVFLKKLLPEVKFDNPKPIKLMKHLISVATKPDDIILDFFSGSGTTAQAVMEINSEDNGHRKYIMVQIPQEIDKKTEAYKSGYRNLCDVGIERIKRSAGQINNNGPLLLSDLDVGFRVFSTDTSNMQDVYFNPKDFSQNRLFELESNIKDDRSDLDLFFGCILDWGLPLSLPYSTETVGGYKIHNYNNGDLIACFEENVSEELVKEIASRQPMRAVFRDSSFGNSPEKINVFEIFKKYMPEDADDISKRVKVI